MARETARGRHAPQRISRLCYELDTSRLNPLSPLRSPADLADPSLKQDATLRAGLGASKVDHALMFRNVNHSAILEAQKLTAAVS